MTNGIFLLLGGNLGEPELTFKKVISALAARKVSVIHQSSLYKSAAWGKSDQPDFLNQVVQISTSLSPHSLLSAILHIEGELGRVRKEKWDPRTIDVDILYFNQEVIKDPVLTIPHPEIQKRKFALMPICEIAPGFIHPVFQKTQQWLLAQCRDHLLVKKVL